MAIHFQIKIEICGYYLSILNLLVLKCTLSLEYWFRMFKKYLPSPVLLCGLCLEGSIWGVYDMFFFNSYLCFVGKSFSPRGRKFEWTIGSPMKLPLLAWLLFARTRPSFSFFDGPVCSSLVYGLVVSAVQPHLCGSFCHQQYIHYSRMTPVRREPPQTNF